MVDNQQAERLLRALAEQLKLPLIQIAHHAELAHENALSEISLSAERALSLVDNYILASTMQQQELRFEPVAISSVLYDVAEALGPMARQYNCELELRLDGKYEPVMANQQGLRAALVTLGQSYIEAGTDSHSRVILAGYKSRNGITAGLFAKHSEQTAELFRRALKSDEPAGKTAASAGLYIADSILRAMAARLYVARHHNLNGLAATFVPSVQLHLV